MWLIKKMIITYAFRDVLHDGCVPEFKLNIEMNRSFRGILRVTSNIEVFFFLCYWLQLLFFAKVAPIGRMLAALQDDSGGELRFAVLQSNTRCIH